MNTTNPKPEASRATGLAIATLIAIAVTAIIAALAFGNADNEAASSSAAEAAFIPASGTLRQVSSVVVAGDGHLAIRLSGAVFEPIWNTMLDLASAANES